MRKLLSVFLLASILFTACTQDKAVKISGTIEGISDGDVVLLDENREEVLRVAAVDGKFEMTNPDVVIGDGRFYLLWVPELGEFNQPSMTRPTIFFMISSNNTELELKVGENGLETKAIKGSPMMDEYTRLNDSNPSKDELDEIITQANEMFHIYNMTEEGQTPENLEKLMELSAKADAVHKQHADYFVDMIESNKDNIALATIIQNQSYNAPVAELKELYAKFDESISDSYPMQWFAERIETMSASAVGSQAPAFTFPDPEGNMVSLSDFKGKYVLVDFWASWCGPCRREIPNLKKLYDDYKDKNLVVLGVSIDQDEAAWRKALEEENLEYPQAYDGKGETGTLYNYQGIPFIVLISPDGEILERDLRGDDMRDKISSYLD